MSAASSSKLGLGSTFNGLTAAVGFAFTRSDSGMVKFAPQYAHAIRDRPAAGSFGAPHAMHGNVCVMAAIIHNTKADAVVSAFVFHASRMI